MQAGEQASSSTVVLFPSLPCFIFSFYFFLPFFQRLPHFKDARFFFFGHTPHPRKTRRYLFPFGTQLRYSSCSLPPPLPSFIFTALPNVLLVCTGCSACQPIPPHILSGLVGGAEKLGTKEGYSGYGAEQGKVTNRPTD